MMVYLMTVSNRWSLFYIVTETGIWAWGTDTKTGKPILLPHQRIDGAWQKNAHLVYG
jgi:hypothetical protein